MLNSAGSSGGGEKKDYLEDLKIDKYNLDREWMRQPMLYMKWAEAWAQAVLERDRAKEQLEVVKAELDSAIRQAPAEFGIVGKPTESAISNAITKHSQYRRAYSNYVEATKAANVLAGAKEAMAHKKKALEGITELMVAGYYAEPNIPKEVRQKVERETTTEIKNGLKRSRRLMKRGNSG